MKEILEKEKLIPLKNFNNMTGTYKFHVLLCENTDNKKILLKISRNDNNIVKNQIEKEFKLTNAVYSFVKLKKLSFTVPQYLHYHINSYPYWLIHEYIEGNPLGMIFNFNKSTDTPEMANKLALCLSEVQTIKKDSINNLNLSSKVEIHDINWYRKQKNENIQFVEKYIKNKKTINTVHNFFDNFPKFQCVATHQDFGFQNIVFNPINQQIGILDWEIFAFDSPARDIAHIWVHSWKKPEWRNLLLEKFISLSNIEKDNLKNIFKLSAILELGYYIKCFDIKRELKTNMQKYYTKTAVNAHIKDLKNIINNKIL
ncbi:hypothetical protein D4R87_00770 [bacterium]|nr:MAG: hypothetical protein D4R87_00770 [bacterium]